MKYRRAKVSDLFVDTRYQRPLDERRVAKMKNHYDERLLGALEGSLRSNGKIAVFDGQHRLIMAEILGLKDLPVLVHENLTPEEEACLFEKLNEERKATRPIDRHKSRVFRGEPNAVELDNAIRSMGYELGYGGGSGNPRIITAYTHLAKAQKLGGASLVEQILAFHDAWAPDVRPSAGILAGLLWLFTAKTNEELDIDRLLKKVMGHDPRHVTRRGQAQQRVMGSGGDHSMGSYVGAELLRIYNERARRRLVLVEDTIQQIDQAEAA